MKNFPRASSVRSCVAARDYSVLLLVCLIASGGYAATVVDDFNDGNDQGWTHYDPLAAFGAAGSYTVSGGTYRLQAPPSPNQAALGPGRAGSLRLDTGFDDFFVSVDLVNWVDTADQAFGLLARIQEPGLGTTDGYGFLYVPADRDFEIERFDNEANDIIGPIIGFTLDPARDYRMTFSGTADMLTGEVFDLADLATPLVTVVAFDVTYSTGVTGLLVADASSGGVSSDATFDNFFAVPEPGNLLLLLAGLCCLARRALLRPTSR